MLRLLLEGFESAWLPCSLILAVPGVAAALAGRDEAGPATAGFVASAILFSWLRFAEIGGGWPIAVAAIALAIAAVLFLVPTSIPPGAAVALGGVLTGGAAAELWEPCVGAEFGRLLTTLPADGLGGLPPLAVFMAGVVAPIGGVLALLKLLPPGLTEPAAPALSILGGATLAVMAIATAAGFHDDVVEQLFRWSL